MPHSYINCHYTGSREAFKKIKSEHFFPHWGWGVSGQNPQFNKIVEKGYFLALFVHFCPFLTLFDRKISGNFPHFGGGGLGGVKKIQTFYFLFIEGFPNELIFICIFWNLLREGLT